MNRTEINDYLEDNYGVDITDTLLADGLDEAFIGTTWNTSLGIRAVYSESKVIEIFMSQGMTKEEAVEYFEYNVLGSCCTDRHPLFVTLA